jgi:hypothetical protein
MPAPMACAGSSSVAHLPPCTSATLRQLAPKSTPTRIVERVQPHTDLLPACPPPRGARAAAGCTSTLAPAGPQPRPALTQLRLWPPLPRSLRRRPLHCGCAAAGRPLAALQRPPGRPGARQPGAGGEGLPALVPEGLGLRLPQRVQGRGLGWLGGCWRLAAQAPASARVLPARQQAGGGVGCGARAPGCTAERLGSARGFRGVWGVAWAERLIDQSGAGAGRRRRRHRVQGACRARCAVLPARAMMQEGQN